MNSKTLLGVFWATAVAGGLAFYFMKKGEKLQKAAPEVPEHSREKFLEILKHLEKERASLYAHWFWNLKSKHKDLDSLSLEMIQVSQEYLQAWIIDLDQVVLKDLNFDKSSFDNLMAVYANDPEVKKINENLKSNYDRIFKLEQLDFHFNLPEEITQQEYFKYLRVWYEKLRYDIYHETQTKLNESGQSQLTKEEFNIIITKCWLPDIKNEVYALMGFPTIEGEKPQNTVYKAYLTMALKDEAWNKEIKTFQQEHSRALYSIQTGTKLEGMDVDPLETFKREIKLRKQGPNGILLSDPHVKGLENALVENASKEEFINENEFKDSIITLSNPKVELDGSSNAKVLDSHEPEKATQNC